MDTTRMLRTAAGILGLKFGAAGLGFLNALLLARLLGPSQFGIYSISLAAVNFAATLAALGLPMLATREAAASAERREWNKLKGLLRFAHQSIFLASLVILGGSAALLLGGFFSLNVPYELTVVAMVLVPMGAFNQLRAGMLRGLHLVILADTPDLLVRPLVMLVLIGGAYLALTHAPAVYAMSMQLGATSLALIVGSWWLLIRQPVPFKIAAPERPQRTLLFEAGPFLGIAIIGALEGQISLYLLGYLGGAAQAGLFQAANQLVTLIALGLVAVNVPLQPRLAAAWASGDKTQVQRLVTYAARVGTAIAVPSALLLFALSKSMLGLYGPDYVHAGPALQVLAVGQIVNALAGSCGILLMMTGHQRTVSQGTALALVLNVIVAYFAVPKLGVLGAALASALGLCIWNAYLATYARIKLGINTTVAKLEGNQSAKFEQG